MERLPGRLLGAGLLGLLAACLSLEGKDRCRTDSDCLDARLCGLDGRCFDPSSIADSGTEEERDAGTVSRCSISACPDGYGACTGFRISIEIVDNSGLAGRHVTLLLDEFGTPHVAYYHATNEDLIYAKRDEQTWSPRVVDGARAGRYASLALDDGVPAIAYRIEEPSPIIRYAREDGADWNIEDIAGTAGGEYVSLVIDADGVPSFGFGGSNGLAYAHRYRGTWTVEQVDAAVGSTEFNTIDNSMVIDALNVVHLVYTDSIAGHLRYAVRDLDQWENGPDLTPPGHDAGYSSVTLDRNGLPHVSYFDRIDFRTKYAHLVGGQWLTEEIGDGGYAATSLALDENDRAHVAYKDGDQKLRYARRVADGEWVVEVLDQRADSGYVSIALDLGGCPHIAYDALRELRYARVIPLR